MVQAPFHKQSVLRSGGARFDPRMDDRDLLLARRCKRFPFASYALLWLPDRRVSYGERRLYRMPSWMSG
jgi:hypothetical protein